MTSLGSLFLEIGLKADDIDRQMQRVQSQVLTAARTIEAQAALKLKVDDRALTDLNKHFNLKQQHYKQVQSDFNKPLTPKVDTSGLDAISNKLNALKTNNGSAVKVAVSSTETVRVVASNEANLEKTLSDLPDKIGKAVRGNAVERAVSAVGRAAGGLANVAAAGVGSVLSIPAQAIGGVARGITEGIGNEVSKNLGSGLSNALERAVGKSIGSTRLLGDKLGGQLGEFVVERFTDRVKTIGGIVEAQIETITDAKLKRQLKEVVEQVKEAPAAVREQVQTGLGRKAITEERLFQGGTQQQAAQSRVPVAREAAIVAWRESVIRAEKVEASATRQLQILQTQLKAKQSEVAKTQQAYTDAEQRIEQARSSGAGLAEMEGLAAELAAAGRDLGSLAQTIATLGSAEKLAFQAVAEAKAARSEASQAVKVVTPEAQPQAYQDVARSLYGEQFNEDKLPKLTVADQSLKKVGAVSQYDPLKNAIEVTTEMYEQVKAGTLTPQQINVLSEELAHAQDFDFGSYKGIRATQQNRVVGKPVVPTAAEFSEIAPNLALYKEERRPLELNAKVQAIRNTEAVQRQSQSLTNLNAGAAFGSDKQFYTQRGEELQTRLQGFQALASKMGGDVSKLVETYSQVFDNLKQEVNALSTQVVADAAAGILDESKLAAYAAKREAQAKQLQAIEQKLNDRIVNYQPPTPEPATPAETPQATALTVASEAKPQTTKERLSNAANQAGSAVRSVVDTTKAVIQSPQAQAIAAGAGMAADAIGAAAKGGYAVAKGIEGVALDLVPMGRTIKGIAQQTVIPAALTSVAANVIPGGHAVMGAMGDMASSALAPFAHGAAGSLSGSASQFLGHALPSLGGIQGMVTGAVTSAIETATTAASSAVAQSAAAVIGGKTLQVAAGRAIGGVTQAASNFLPNSNQTKALPDVSKLPEAITVQAQVVPPERAALALSAAATGRASVSDREGLFSQLNEQYSAAGLRDVAKRVGITSTRAKSLKKEDLARELATTDFGVPIDQVLAEVGDSAKLKAFQTGAQGGTPKLPETALETIKTNNEKIKQLHKEFQAAQDQQRLALAQTIATESDQQLAAIADAFKSYQVAGKDAQQLAGIRTQTEKRSTQTNAEARAASSAQIQQTQQQAGQSRSFAVVPQIDAGEDLKAQMLSMAKMREQVKLGIARAANIEPQETLPATLKSAAISPRGKDLMVNTAGFAASVAGSHFGTVPALAGDLMGALAMRNAVSGGKHGNGADMFGDLAGFAVGNGAAAIGSMVPGLAGIPLKGAAVAMAAVPQLSKLRERIQGRVSGSNEAAETGEDLKAQSLDVVGMSRSLNSKRKKALEALEQSIGSAMDELALTLAKQPDLVDNAKLTRTLNRLNQATERLLDERGEIIDRIFEEEMQKANAALLEIGAKAQRKIDKAPDLGLLADRAIDNQTQAQSQKVIRENVPEIQANRRTAYQMEREGGAPVQEVLKVGSPQQFQGFGSGLIQQAKELLDGINQDMSAGVQKRVAVLLTEAKSLVNDIETSRIVTAAGGDKQGAAALGKVGGQARAAIATGDSILAKPQRDIKGADLGKLKEVERSLQGVYAQVDRPLPSGGGFLGGLSGLGGKALGLLKEMVAGFIAFQVIQQVIPSIIDFGKQSLEAAMNVDRLQTALDFAAGSASKGAENMAFIDKTVNDLKIPLSAAREGYVMLAAATKDSAVEGKATNDVFEGMSQATTVLGLSADDAKGAFLALGQMASKGKVQAEELRGQLGERIPGAFQIAARAMGVTEVELNKMLDTGQVLSDEFLPKFGAQLKKEFGGSAVDASKNAQSALFNFQTAIQRTQESFGRMIQPAQMAGLNAASGAIQTVSDHAAFIIPILATVGATLLRIVIPALLALAKTLPFVAEGFKAMQASFSVGPLLIFAAQFAAIMVLLEVGRNLFNRFVPSDLGNRFKDGAKSIQDDLDKIADKARAARGEISKIPQKEPERLSDGGWIDKAQVKSDNFFRGAAKNVGIKWENTETAGERQFKNDKGENSKFVKTLNDASVLDEDSLRGTLDKTKGIDSDLQRLQFKQLALKGAPQPDKKALDAVNKEITDKTAERKTTGESFTDQYDVVNKSLKQAKDGIKAIEESSRPDWAKQQLIEPLEKTVTNLETAKQSMDDLQKSVGVTVDPARKLLGAFEEMNTKIEQINRNAQQTFNEKMFSVNTQALKGFDNDVDASGKGAVAKAEADAERLKDIYEKTSSEQDRFRKEISDPITQDMLKSAVTSSGKGITMDSSVADIEDAKKRLKDGDSKKDVLDKLKGFRESSDKLTEMRPQLPASELAVKDARQQLEQNRLSRATADEQATLKRNELTRSAALIPQRTAITQERVTLTTQKARNVFYSDADANVASSAIGIKEADAGIAQARAQIANTKEQEQAAAGALERLRSAYDRGKISAEQFHNQERDLTTQVAEARGKSIEASAALQDAFAKRTEAVAARIEAQNRRLIEQADMMQKKAEAAIALTRTRGTTELQGSLLNNTDAGELSQEQFARTQILNDQSDANARTALKQRELEQTRQFARDGVISRKDAADKEMAIVQSLADAQQQSMQRQVQMQQQLRDSRIKLLEGAAKLESEQIDRAKQLLDAQGALAKAQSDLSLTRTQGQINQADRAFGLKDKIESQKDLDPRLKALMSKQLNESGLSGINANSKSYEILAAKQKLEDEASEKTKAAREQEFEFARKSFELEQKKTQELDRQNVFAAQRYKLDADRAKIQAIKDYSESAKTGDKLGMQLAGASFEIAGNQSKTADDQLAVANDRLNTDKQLADLGRQTLGVNQQKAREEAFNADQLRRQNNELSFGEQFVKAGSSGSIPGRAIGGDVASDRPYLVGEQGQEIFIPKVNGEIIPAHTTERLLKATSTIGLSTKEAAIAQAMKAGKLPARANGGSVMAGQPYLVGEKGAEAFSPQGGAGGGISDLLAKLGLLIAAIGISAKGAAKPLDPSMGTPAVLDTAYRQKGADAYGIPAAINTAYRPDAKGKFTQSAQGASANILDGFKASTTQPVSSIGNSFSPSFAGISSRINQGVNTGSGSVSTSSNVPSGSNGNLDSKLDQLISLLGSSLNSPRSLTVSSPSPVQDAAKIMSDIATQTTSNAGL